MSSVPPNDGNHAVGMIAEDGYLIMKFQHPIDWLKMEPQNAMEIAGAMIKMAMEIKTGRPVTDGMVEKLLADTKRDIKIDQAREVLINRMMLMLGSFEGGTKTLEWRARQVVDTILVEVT